MKFISLKILFFFALNVKKEHNINMKHLQTFMDDLLAKGKLYFSKEQALSFLGGSENAFHLQIQRLYKKQRVVLVGHGFYVIVPTEYRNQGCFPAHWLIDPYFYHLQKDYYVSLLSAAAFYGATQQQPMVFQVMVDHMKKPLKLPKNVMISFHLQRHMRHAQTQERQIPTGSIRFSTRSQTIVDLVRFYKQAGYLNNVALIISDFIKEGISPEDLETVLPFVETTVIQRLGYIFDELGATHLSLCVQKILQTKQRVAKTLLKPEAFPKTGKCNEKWQLIINDPLDI